MKDLITFESIVSEIKEKVSREVVFLKEVNDVNLNQVILDEIIKRSAINFIDKAEKEILRERVFNELRKFGRLEPYLQDARVTEIMINGPNKVFIEIDGSIEETELKFSKQELESIIQKMTSSVNRSVNQAVPIVDARLLDGSRINVVLEPIALNGPIVTIRKFSKEVFKIEDLIHNQSVTEEVAEFLKKMVKTKHNIFISGGTGSGKTTLLNILSNFIPANERIITIEDSAELNIKNVKNVVSLETRNNNSEGFGAISIRDLLKSSLRMRPDRIIVGEVRGRETLDMLQAMNTGHDGSLSTGHANSARDMLIRLESMVVMNYDIPIDAVRRQIASAIDVIVHVTKFRNGKRKIKEIIEILDYKDGTYVLNQLYNLDEHGVLVRSNELSNTYKVKELTCMQ